MKGSDERMVQLQTVLTDKQLNLRERQDEILELQHELENMRLKFEEKSKDVMAIKQEAVIQIK